MNIDLYFLRSFEQNIATELLSYAFGFDDNPLELDTYPSLRIYDRFYGLSRTDVGVYAMVDNKIAGGAWVRLLKGDAKGQGKGYAYLDDETPELILAVKPEFRNLGLATKIMEQLLTEVSQSFDQISLSLPVDSQALAFFERLGFTQLSNTLSKHDFFQKDASIMIKKLQKPTQSHADDDWYKHTQKWRNPNQHT